MAVELDVPQPLLLVPGQGEVVADSPERRVEILCDRDELVVTWTRFGPRRDGAAAHVHRHHCDLFFALEGELTFLLGPAGEERVLLPGTLVLAPPLVVHGFRNAGDGELRFLNFHAPAGGFANYLRGATSGLDAEDPPADGGRPAADALIVPPATGGILVDRDEIRIAIVDEAGPASARTTCLYAFPDGRFLEIQA